MIRAKRPAYTPLIPRSGQGEAIYTPSPIDFKDRNEALEVSRQRHAVPAGLPDAAVAAWTTRALSDQIESI